MKKMKKLAVTLALGMTIMSGSSCSLFGGNAQPEKWEYLLEGVSDVKNVILMIGDGMGPEQIKAGEIYKGEKLVFQNFPYKVNVNTDSWFGVTDSAAAATAMATGQLTYTGFIGMNFKEHLGEEPAELETIVDIAASMGKRTGVLTTEVLYGATPMGFSAHSASRNNTEELLESAARNSNVNLFASETFSSSYNSIFTKNGYTQISNVANISDAQQDKIFGSYNIKANAKSMTAGDKVAFDYLVTEALEYLSQDEDGFFLMAEGAHIDHGGHNNDMQYMLEELLAFDDAVKAVLEWTKGRTDTIVIVTADHETGCLMLSSDATRENLLAEKGGKPINYMWGSTSHTATEVFCFINGVDIEFSNYSFEMSTKIKNTDIFNIIKDLFEGKLL